MKHHSPAEASHFKKTTDTNPNRRNIKNGLQYTQNEPIRLVEEEKVGRELPKNGVPSRLLQRREINLFSVSQKTEDATDLKLKLIRFTLSTWGRDNMKLI